MSSPKPLILSTGSLELTLNPSVGGSISALEWIAGDRRVPVLRKCNSCSENVLEAASFPLVPYVNRIRGGRFAFRGREVYADHPNGMQKSKLARALTDKRLGVTATARNWNTVVKLHELSLDPPILAA